MAPRFHRWYRSDWHNCARSGCELEAMGLTPGPAASPAWRSGPGVSRSPVWPPRRGRHPVLTARGRSRSSQLYDTDKITAADLSARWVDLVSDAWERCELERR